MYTDVQVINLGLAKLSASRIQSITPPRSALEIHCKENYPAWKRSELAKRRWVFALVDNYAMTLGTTTPGVDRPYQFALPPNCLRPVRQRYTEWVQRGRFLYSAYNVLTIEYISDVPESDFDPLFVDVLAWRIAIECVEMVTQSNTKKADASTGYKDARNEAGRANAFVIGSEDIAVDDYNFPFVSARYV
jgi:hypothetical protein